MLSFFSKLGFNMKLPIEVFGKLPMINYKDFVTINTSSASSAWSDWLWEHHSSFSLLYQNITPFMFNEKRKTPTIIGIIEPSSDRPSTDHPRIFPFSLYLVFPKKLNKHKKIENIYQNIWLFLLTLRNKVMTLNDYKTCYSLIMNQSFDMKTQLQHIDNQNNIVEYNTVYYPNIETWPRITLCHNYVWE